MNKNIFNSIQLTAPKKNVFDLTHDVKMSLSMGNIYPILALECVPGDKFSLSCESLLRFAPLVAPVMHRMDVTMHYFFVPNRLTWPNWENFITNTDLETVAFPTIQFDDANPVELRSLADYLGLPLSQTPVESSMVVSALPFAAYQMVYNEYYRDQNLILPIDYELIDGSNNANTDLFQIRKRAWQHDYFTAALPWAQKGTPVELPLGTVELIPQADYAALPDSPIYRSKVTGVPVAGDITAEDTGDPTIFASPGVTPLVYDPQGTLTVGATTINDFRRAMRLQEWLEKAARGGSRYVESILVHFGLKSQDARLQRPEYITGTKSPVVISEILNSTGEEGGLPQGNMAGHGISVTSGQYGNYFCQEHGYIIGVMSVLPLPAYSQGIPKHFLKTEDPFQFYFPSFANLGEQEVQVQEIYAGTIGKETIFGYVPRYAEYKYLPSRIAGDFRMSLNYWHLGREFDGEPALNQAFVECDPRRDIFAITDPNVDLLYCHVLNKIRAIRPMPKFGTPSF